MAQKREKEETELKVPETLTLCTPPSISAAVTKLSGADELRSSSPSPDRSDLKVLISGDAISRSQKRPDIHRKVMSSPVKVPDRSSSAVNRCSGCRKKVGLIGFRCRCGEMFCSDHRYSDRHDCSYDYKAAGREAIARENPVVRASKILKV